MKAESKREFRFRLTTHEVVTEQFPKGTNLTWPVISPVTTGAFVGIWELNARRIWLTIASNSYCDRGSRLARD